jgi:carboxyl-terminal processing protease
MTRLRALLLLPILGLPFLAAPVRATPTQVEIDALDPTAAQVRATELVTNFISNYHYKKVKLDDQLSGRVLDRYLENLDPNKSYFTADDVAAFAIHRDNMDDYLIHSQLQPAFDIFIRYRERVDARVAQARRLLADSFDFSINEDFAFDRSDLTWAGAAELDEFWRKRVKNDVLGLKLAGKSDTEITQTLTRRYEDLARRTAQINHEDVFELFINAYLTSIEPHTAYFSPRTSENFRIRMSLSLEGIGAILQADNEYTLVRQVLKGGPAERSGQLHEDDRITGVGQGVGEPIVDVIGWRLDDVVDLIRGKKDSVVRLQVLSKGLGPEGPTKVVTLTRSKIDLEDEAAKKSTIEIGEPDHRGKVGIITIPTFYQDFEARARGDDDYRSTTRDVHKLVDELKREDVQGIVIDLRGNGGGSLSEATELTGLFIDTGPVVQVQGSDGAVHIERDTNPGIAYGGPLAVLVDGNSASASEIFAAAMQDYHRGVIIGEPTFGKGTVQNLIDLDQYDHSGTDQKLGQLKATVAQFFRIAGDSTQHRGVIPDIGFPSAAGSEEQGERALPNALPWAQIEPANFVPARAPISEFSTARTRHDQRLADSRAFHLLQAQEAAAQDARKKTTVSLVQEIRKLEQERAEREQKEREVEFRASVGLPPIKDGETAPSDEPKVDIVLDEAAQVLADLIAPEPVIREAGPAPGFAASPAR